MERLTSSGWPNGNKFLFANVHPKRKDMQPAFQKTVNRLGAYEDLDRTPEQLASDLTELAEYREKIADGRCVALPCKVGDEIFSFRWSINNQKYEVCAGKVKNVRYDSADSSVMVSDGEFYRVWGKTVFLTLEAAENARKEQNDEITI